MSRISPIDPHKLIKILRKIGFTLIRQKGSHVILSDGRGRRTVVPVHPGRKIKPSLVRAIISEVGISREEYFELLRKDC